MAMTKQLWSINGLATELGMDRRTVARRLAGVPADGRLHGKAAWLMTTALAAINDKGKAHSSRRHPMTEHFRSRIEDWEELRLGGEDPIEWDITQTCERFDIPREQMLDWLRAGMAYRKQGDWRTGEGFTLHPHQVLDWQIFMRAVSFAANDPGFLREIGMEKRPTLRHS